MIPFIFYCGDGHHGLHYIFKSDQIKNIEEIFIQYRRLDGPDLKQLFSLVIIFIKAGINYICCVFFFQ